MDQDITLRLEQHDQELPRRSDPVSSPSPEMFSFPGTPTAEDGEESEFEFGSCVISPRSPRPATSPADQFFLNGRLLPHAFPVSQPGVGRASFSGRDSMISNILSRGTSVGSSVSSKEYSSLLSSRSNSTNSRGGAGSACSTCSSARTSSSEVSERRAFQKRIKSKGSFREQRNVSGNHLSSNNNNYHQFGGASQRWQFITPAPVLGPSTSRRVGVGPAVSPRKKKREEREGGNNNNSKENEGFLQRILRTFLETCMACHAMETQEKEYDLDNCRVLAN